MLSARMQHLPRFDISQTACPYLNHCLTLVNLQHLSAVIHAFLVYRKQPLHIAVVQLQPTVFTCMVYRMGFKVSMTLISFDMQTFEVKHPSLPPSHDPSPIQSVLRIERIPSGLIKSKDSLPLLMPHPSLPLYSPDKFLLAHDHFSKAQGPDQLSGSTAKVVAKKCGRDSCKQSDHNRTHFVLASSEQQRLVRGA